MMRRGQGRGVNRNPPTTTAPQEDVKGFENVSLHDYIQVKKVVRSQQEVDPTQQTLQDYIKKKQIAAFGPGGPPVVKPTKSSRIIIGQQEEGGAARDYDADVNKDLQTVIKERGIDMPALACKGSAFSRKKRSYRDLDAGCGGGGDGSDDDMERDEEETGRPKFVKGDMYEYDDDQQEGKEIKKKALNYEAMDELQRVGGGDEKRSSSSRERRRPSITPGGIMTPFRALNAFCASEHTMDIFLRIGRLSEMTGADKNHLWRCEIVSGNIKVICDSNRKVVAREMASKEFLKNVKKQLPATVNIPRYAFSSHLLTDPRIFHKLEKLAGEQGIELTQHTAMSSDPNNKMGKSYFVCTYAVGEEYCIGDGHNIEIAKLNAAKKVYKVLTGEEYQPTVYFLGDDCPADLEYDMSETDVLHVLEKSLTADANFGRALTWNRSLFEDTPVPSIDAATFQGPSHSTSRASSACGSRISVGLETDSEDEDGGRQSYNFKRISKERGLGPRLANK